MAKLFLGFIPGLIWLLFFLHKDRAKPEPKKMILKAFCFGMLITPIAAIFELGFLKVIALPVFLIAAPVEETLKYLVFKFKIAKARAYDEPIDAMIYMITIALGFASIENIILISKDGSDALSLLVLRFLSATLLHALAAGIIGYYIARKRVIHGLLLATGFHMIYNYIAVLNQTISLLFLGVLLIFMFALVSLQFQKLKLIKKHG